MGPAIPTLPTELNACTPGCFSSRVRKIFSVIIFISASVYSAISSTSMMAMTGLPATLGSFRAMRLAPFTAEASLTMHRIGTGQNRPLAVFIFSATDRASAFFMKPLRGLKYPPPSITALAAAAEQPTTEGRPAASFTSAARLASSITYSGFSLSEPWGLIMPQLLLLVGLGGRWE